jgi:peptidoglycan/LPS O-acetylase OafA/YrhL
MAHLLRNAGSDAIEEYPHEPHFTPGFADASLAKPFAEFISLNVKAKKPNPAGWRHGSRREETRLDAPRHLCLDRTEDGGPMNSAAPRLPFLDALRGYAILGVIVVHVEQVAPLSAPLAEKYAQHGNRGVQLFFLVSAVSIAMAWHARADGYMRFLVRRLFRLLPALTIAAIAYATIGGTHPKWWHAALTLTFLNGWQPSAIDSAVPGAWSLSSEMMFYLSVPILALGIRSLRAAAAWLLCAQAIFMTMAASRWTLTFWNAVNPDGVGYPNETWLGTSPIASARWFIIGWTTYLVMQKFALPQRASQALLCVGLACLVLAPVSPSWTLHELGFMFGLPAVLYAMSRGAGALLDTAPMRWLGTISYSMYLWHFVIVWRLGDYLQAPSFLLLFACTLALTTVGATVTYLLIERPGIRLGSALLRGAHRRSARQLDPNAAPLSR